MEIVDVKVGELYVFQSQVVIGIVRDHHIRPNLLCMGENILEIVEHGLSKLDHVSDARSGRKVTYCVMAESRFEHEGIVTSSAIEYIVPDTSSHRVGEFIAIQ